LLIGLIITILSGCSTVANDTNLPRENKSSTDLVTTTPSENPLSSTVPPEKTTIVPTVQPKITKTVVTNTPTLVPIE